MLIVTWLCQDGLPKVAILYRVEHHYKYADYPIFPSLCTKCGNTEPSFPPEIPRSSYHFPQTNLNPINDIWLPFAIKVIHVNSPSSNNYNCLT